MIVLHFKNLETSYLLVFMSIKTKFEFRYKYLLIKLFYKQLS